MQKLSCSYEVVQPGVSRTQRSMLNIPVSACLVTLQNLMENKGFTNTYDYDIDKFTSTNQYYKCLITPFWRCVEYY